MSSVRPLTEGDVGSTSRLHLEILDMEFLARCGEGFIRCYQQAWIASPYGIALGFVDGGRIVGAVFGALDPSRHFRTMVRTHGWRLALRLVAHAVIHPRFAAELVNTRAARYTRGLARVLIRSLRSHDGSPTDPDPVTPRIGEVTHVMVSEEARGKGVARALLEEVRCSAVHAGVSELVLVTPPDLEAVGFYEHLGWKRGALLTSRSGELFVRYSLPLRASRDAIPPPIEPKVSP